MDSVGKHLIWSLYQTAEDIVIHGFFIDKLVLNCFLLGNTVTKGSCSDHKCTVVLSVI